MLPGMAPSPSPEPRTRASSQPCPLVLQLWAYPGGISSILSPTCSLQPLSRAAWSGHSRPQRHLCTPASPVLRSHPSAPPVGGSSLPTKPAQVFAPSCKEPSPALHSEYHSEAFRDASSSFLSLPVPASSVRASVASSQTPGCPQTPGGPAGCLLGRCREDRPSVRRPVSGRAHTREPKGLPAGSLGPRYPSVCAPQPLPWLAGSAERLFQCPRWLLAFARCPGASAREGPTLLSAASGQTPAIPSAQERCWKGGQMPCSDHLGHSTGGPAELLQRSPGP